MNREERQELFFKTAFLRHQIYVLKELGIAKPWTNNKIFQTNYFCNVFRYLDKTSVWIIKNAIEPNEGNPELWKTIIMCRYISRIDTLQKLKDEDCLIGNQQKAFFVLREMQGKKEKIFTNAFIVNSKVPGGWTDKVTYLFTLIRQINQLFYSDPDMFFIKCQRMKKMYSYFLTLPGVATFMAYQYTVDFTYSKRYLYMSVDKSSWVSLGLGAVRGMNRLISGEVTRKSILNPTMEATELLAEWEIYVFNYRMDWIDKTQKIVNEKFKGRPIPNVRPMFNYFSELDLRDVQTWLCEYDKYCRGGSKKRKYPGI